MLVAVLAQLELTSHQWEISSVSSPKWQTFISSRLTLSGFETLKELLFVKLESIFQSDGARSCFLGAATGRGIQEHRAQLVQTGTGLFDGTAATPSAWQWTRAGRAPQGDVLLLPLCFLRHPTGSCCWQLDARRIGT